MVYDRIKKAALGYAYKKQSQMVKQMYKTTKNRTQPYLRGGTRVIRTNDVVRSGPDVRHVGFSTTSSYTKRHIAANTVYPGFGTRSLTTFNLCSIPRTTEIKDRLRNIVNISGFKIHLESQNVLGGPLVLNYAVLSPKASKTISNTDFFRGNELTRGTVFGTSQTSMTLNFADINSDDYNVLMRKTIKLGSAFTPESVAFAETNSMETSFWVPVNRQVRFNDNTNDCDSPIFFCIWCDQTTQPSGTLSVANAARIGIKAVTYFRDVV